jgi:hypothetical protein
MVGAFPPPGGAVQFGCGIDGSLHHLLASHHLPMVKFGWILAVVVELGGGSTVALLDRIHQDALTRVEEALHRFLDRTLAGVVSHG